MMVFLDKMFLLFHAYLLVSAAYTNAYTMAKVPQQSTLNKLEIPNLILCFITQK